MPAIARCILRLSFVLSSVITAGSAQTPNACASQPYCADTNDFLAVITNFRTSTVNNIKVIDATVRFQNKTNQPLTLGSVLNSGVAADDRGNRLFVAGPNGYH